jgi:hypothetical protein
VDVYLGAAIINFLTEDHFNAAMQTPKMAAEVLRMLTDDMGIVLAIMGGPNGNEDTYKQLIFKLRMELLTTAIVAKKRLDEHLSGSKTAIQPKMILPH